MSDELDDFILGKKSNPKRDIVPLLDSMRSGTSKQESSGNTTVVNPDSGATGEFQVMEDNIPTWTQKHLKRRLTVDQFKKDRQAQIDVFNGEMGEYLSEALDKSPTDEDKAVRMAAASWYGGKGNAHLYDDPKPQISKGKKYPSFREYTTSILGKTRQATTARNADLDAFIGNTSLDSFLKSDSPNKQTDDLDELILGKKAKLGSEGVQPSPTFPNGSPPMALDRMPAYAPPGKKGKAGSPAKPAAPPQATELPVYQKRQKIPGQMYYRFEETGSTDRGDEYLGMVDGRFRFRDPEGDEFEVTDPRSGSVKYIGERKKALDAEKNEYELSDQTNVPKGAVRRTRLIDGQPKNFLFRDGKIEEELERPPAKDADYYQYRDYQFANRKAPISKKDFFKAAASDFGTDAEISYRTETDEQKAAREKNAAEITAYNAAVGKQTTAELSTGPRSESSIDIEYFPSEKSADQSFKQGADSQVIGKLANRLGVSYEAAEAAYNTDATRVGKGGDKGEADEQYYKDLADSKQSGVISIGGDIIEKAKQFDVQINERKAALTAKEAEYRQQGVDKFESQLLALKDSGVPTYDGKPIDEAIEAERKAKKEWEDDTGFFGLVSNKDWNKMNNTTSFSPDPSMGGRAPVGVSRDDVAGYNDDAKAKDLEAQKSRILSQYGSFSNWQKSEEQFKKKYQASPNLYILKSAESAVGGAMKAPLEGIASALKSISIGAEAIDRALGDENADATRMGFYGLGRDLTEITNEYVKVDKDFKGGKAELFGNVIGQVATQIVLGTATGGAAAPALFGAGMGAAAQYDEATQAGSTGWERLGSAGVGGLLAASDYFIFRSWFRGASVLEKGRFFGNLVENIKQSLISKGILKAEAQQIAAQVADGFWAKATRFTLRRTKEGGKESLQEISESKGNDLYAYLNYDPTPERFERLTTFTDENLVEGVAGFFGGIVGSTIGDIASRAENLSPAALAEIDAKLDEIKEELPPETFANAKTAISSQKAKAAKVALESPKATLPAESNLPAGNIPAYNDFDASLTDGRRVKVIDDRGKLLLVEDDRGRQTLQPERKFADLDQFRSSLQNSPTPEVPETQGETPAVAQSPKDDAEFVHERLDTTALDQLATEEPVSATDAAHEAATSPQNDLPEPSQAMKEAGNYRKGHISINGLDISVENPVGSKREGVDRDGKAWSVDMKNHYGYLKRTVGADEENIDVFVKDGTPADFAGNVFVVDQTHPDTGTFDEHKVLLGFENEKEARDAYASNYAKNWKGLKAITAMPFEKFKTWARDAEQNKPVAELKPTTDLETKLAEETERRKVAERESDTDPLTKLLNKRALDRILPAAEADPKKGVVSFDMNDFGQVNKELGHSKGNDLLKEVADIQNQARREIDPEYLPARPGGDEFVGVGDIEKLPAVVKRVEELFGTKEFERKDGSKFKVSITGTIGNTFDEADSGLQDAKKKRKKAQNVKPFLTDDIVRPKGEKQRGFSFAPKVSQEPTKEALPVETKPVAAAVGPSKTSRSFQRPTLDLGVYSVEIKKLPKNKALTPREYAIQDATIARLQADPQKFVDAYEQLPNPKTVDPDKARELFDEYRENKLENSNAVHAASAALARLILQKRLAELPVSAKVMLMAGGPASGKTSVANVGNTDLVYDTLMWGKEENRELIDQVIEAGKKLLIAYVHRPIEKAAVGMLKRLNDDGRPVTVKVLAFGHFSSQQAFFTDTATYAEERGADVRFFETIEGEPPREISFGDLQEKAYSSLEDVKHDAERAIRQELQDGHYDQRTRDFFEQEPLRMGRQGSEGDLLDEADSASGPDEDPGDRDEPLKSARPEKAQVSDFGFYSAVEQAILDRMPVRASAEQVKNLLNPQKTQGIKQDELDWLGLDAFLSTTENFTKDEVLDFVRSNNVDVREVLKDETKYSEHTLPGGENYKELLLTMPTAPRDAGTLAPGLSVIRGKDGDRFWNLEARNGKRIFPNGFLTREELDAAIVADPTLTAARTFQSGHFAEPNILAHVRFDERDGGSSLHIAEIQSDWHQGGRDAGYSIDQTFDWSTIDNAVPHGPFKKSWHELAFKAALRHAVEGGFNTITWDTGSTQADRYDLSQELEKITFNTTPAGHKYVRLHSQDPESPDIDFSVIDGKISGSGFHSMEGKAVDAAVGKEIAKKIDADDAGEIKEEGLRIGESGMSGFYDQIVPNFVRKYVKKWGAKVEPGTINTRNGNVAMVHRVEITPEMRESVKSGQPLFRARDADIETALDQVEGADLGELVERADPKDLVRDGYKLETTSLEVYELARRAVEESELSKGNEKPQRFDALFFDPDLVASVTKIFRDGAREAVNAGLTVSNAAKLETLAQTIDDAAKEGGGSAIMYLFDDAVPHEDWHRAGFQQAADKRLAERHSSENLDALASSDVVQKLRDGAFKSLYPNASDAVVVEEASAWLAGGSRERLNEMNRKAGVEEITEDEAARFLTDWVQSYKEKNPDANLDEFSKIDSYVERIIEQSLSAATRRKDTSQDRSIEVDGGNNGPSPANSNDQGEDARERGQTEGNESDTDTGSGDVAPRRRAAFSRMLGQDVTYEPQGHEETEEQAIRLESQRGTQTVIDEVLSSSEPSAAKMRVVYRELERLNAVAEIHRDEGNQHEYETVIQEIANLSAGIITRQIEGGRETEIAKTLEPLSPEAAVLTATRLKQRAKDDPDFALSIEQTTAVREAAQDRQSTAKRLVKAENQIARLEETIADLEKNRLPRPKRTQPQKSLYEDLVAKRAEIVDRLKSAFEATVIENPALSMARPTETAIDDETRKDLQDYAALMVLDGKSYAELMNGLDEVSNHTLDVDTIKRIHADAVNLIRPDKRTISTEAKERMSIRHEHYREVEKYEISLDPRRLLTPAARRVVETDNNADNEQLVTAVKLLTARGGRSINAVVGGLAKEHDLTPDGALEVAQGADALLMQAKADIQNEKAEAKGLLEDERQALRQAKLDKGRASHKLNLLLRDVSANPNMMQRFNSTFRAKLVFNWGTQAWNAIQAVTVATPQETFHDIVETTLRRAKRLMGKTDPEADLNPEVRYRDALLPYWYMVGSRKHVAEEILSAYPEQYFRIFNWLIADVNSQTRQLAGEQTNIVSKAGHAVFDADEKLNKLLSTISLAQAQETHVRVAIFTARIDQTLKARGSSLKSALADGTLSKQVREADTRIAADRALRVTYAELMDKTRVERSIKRAYDQFDRFLPVFLNPVVYARFTYTVTKAVANAHLFGALDAKAAGGQGYDERSAAKGIFFLTMIGMAYALMNAYGGDDDKWNTLYFEGPDQPPVDIRRIFPLSAFFYSAHLISNFKEGRPVVGGKDALDSVKNLVEGYASLDLDYYGRSAGVEFLHSLIEYLSGTNLDAKENLTKNSGRFVGNTVASLARFFKPIRDVYAQVNEEEAKLRDYKGTFQDKFVQEVARTVPIGALYGADVQKHPVTGEELVQPFPAGRLIGINQIHPLFTSRKPTLAEEWSKHYFPNNFSGSMNEEELKVFRIRKELKEAVRTGEITAAEVEPKIVQFVKDGKLSARSADILRQDLELTALQEIIKRNYTAGSVDDEKALKLVETLMSDKEKQDVEPIVQAKRENKAEEAEKTLLETLKSAPTDKAVKIFLRRQASLSDQQKDDFKSLIKSKAENANEVGELTDDEIANIRKVIPDFKILKSLPSLKNLPSQFANEYESLKIPQ